MGRSLKISSEVQQQCGDHEGSTVAPWECPQLPVGLIFLFQVDCSRKMNERWWTGRDGERTERGFKWWKLKHVAVQRLQETMCVGGTHFSFINCCTCCWLCKLNVYVGIGTPSKLQPTRADSSPSTATLLYDASIIRLGVISVLPVQSPLHASMEYWGSWDWLPQCMDDRWEEEEGVIRSRFDLGIVSFDLFHI